MSHKYIESIVDIKNTPYGWCDDDDEREIHWQKEQKLYGFDSRETWSLDSTFMFWLYERLMMFKDYADDFIDLDFHKFIIDDKEMTQRECIDEMIKCCESYILSNDDAEEFKLKNRVLDIWKECIHSMWW